MGVGHGPVLARWQCLALRETTDSGRSWSSRPLPASLVGAADRKVDGAPADLWGGSGFGLNVRFADPRDGWIYGGLEVPGSVGPALWSTHNGGLSWRQQPTEETDLVRLRPGSRRRQGVRDGRKDGLGRRHGGKLSGRSGRLARGPGLGQQRWGAEPSGTIVLQGRSGWLVEGNDRGTAGGARLDSEGQWAPWTPPCASVGNSFAVPAASGASNLVAVCVMGGFAYGLSKAAPPGAALGSSWLYFSEQRRDDLCCWSRTGASGVLLRRRARFTGPRDRPGQSRLLR